MDSRLTTHYHIPTALIADLVHANRILAHHKVLDTFGHVSIRCRVKLPHPSSSSGSPTPETKETATAEEEEEEEEEDCFLQATYHAPALVTPTDIALFSTTTGDAVDPTETRKGALERHIHAGVYRARPDIQAVLHCHAPLLVSYSILAPPRPPTSPTSPSSPSPAPSPYPTPTPNLSLRPVVHVGASTGLHVPVYDIAARSSVSGAGPETDLLIRTPALGDDLARSFTDGVGLVLMRGHGATVASRRGVRDVVHKGIYAVVNAEILRDALLLSGAGAGGGREVRGLSGGEVEACGDGVNAVERSWPAWVAEVDAGGGLCG